MFFVQDDHSRRGYLCVFLFKTLSIGWKLEHDSERSASNRGIHIPEGISVNIHVRKSIFIDSIHCMCYRKNFNRSKIDISQEARKRRKTCRSWLSLPSLRSLINSLFFLHFEPIDCLDIAFMWKGIYIARIVNNCQSTDIGINDCLVQELLRCLICIIEKTRLSVHSSDFCYPFVTICTINYCFLKSWNKELVDNIAYFDSWKDPSSFLYMMLTRVWQLSENSWSLGQCIKPVIIIF